MKTDYVLSLGRIQRPRGLEGGLRVTSLGDFLVKAPLPIVLTLFDSSAVIDGFLASPKALSKVELVKVLELSSNLFEIKIKEVHDADSAGKLTGFFLGILLEDARQIWGGDPQHPYLFEYIGLNVFFLEKKIGFITRVIDLPNNPLLEIYLGDKSIEIPLNAPFLDKIDFTEKSLDLIDIDGFL